ncbi:MAG TPA: transglutaminase domain-containing protein [Aggregatilinea sp.]|uniref:transglutaminase family protein n=1 Tax=Aggregatilinea sp. TaxID=2806333 RepID=UPI002C8F9121|nr:transglutaminase domain-containing protein [Aggregatilinea sp.]HML20428.1 transglutaminase domain-containing protein [Aggregatilinea sp.]
MPSRWRRRLRNNFRAVFARGDISSLLMAWGLMIVTALALDAAHWAAGTGLLVTVSIVSVAFGFLLARSHFSELIALLVTMSYSVLVVSGLASIALVDDGSLRSRVATLAERINAWVSQAVSGGQPANDETVFVLFLAVLFWFLGHNTAWHIFRVDRVWRVIVPTGLVLITNQFYYQGDASLSIYLAAFFVLSLLLLIRSHIDAREFDWYMHRVSFPGSVRRTFFQAGGVLAALIVSLAWLAPVGQDDKNLDRLNEFLSGEPFADLADLWNRLFSSLEGEGIATADYYGGDQLELGGAIRLGDQPVMLVEAPEGPRYYWRSTVFDRYGFDGSQWEWRHTRTVRAYTESDGLELNIGEFTPGSRQDVEQTVTMLIRSTRLVYAAPQPVEFGLPVEAELDCVEDLGRLCVNENRPADVSVVRARETLRTGTHYTVTSSISTATADQLRAADMAYPDWVLRLYLQGAGSVAPSVQQLAAQIVSDAGAVTPYDKAKAIERWLRANIMYNEQIPEPPAGVDPVQWFLFDLREGYCNYYATSMVMMLRAQGIPARMAAGFAQGVWDPEQGGFLVKERDAHTWVEVYFPGYGWIEFEPTADEAPLDREGDQSPVTSQQQTPQPTFTPLPTFTPTPQPTDTPVPPTPDGGANATPTGAAEQPVMPATSTPMPTPTATPAAPENVTRVDSGGSSIGRTILLTLGIFMLVVLAGIALGAFIIWYIEYRGLGGLTAVQKAYARLGIYGRWLGLRPAQAATPDERRRYLIGAVPEGEEPINAITRAYIVDRYGSPARQPGPSDPQTMQTAWHEARTAFIRRKLAWLRRRK